MNLFDVLSQPFDVEAALERAKERARECRTLARESIAKARAARDEGCADSEGRARYYAEEACRWRQQAAQAVPTMRELIGPPVA